MLISLFVLFVACLSGLFWVSFGDDSPQEVEAVEQEVEQNARPAVENNPKIEPAKIGLGITRKKVEDYFAKSLGVNFKNAPLHDGTPRTMSDAKHGVNVFIRGQDEDISSIGLLLTWRMDWENQKSKVNENLKPAFSIVYLFSLANVYDKTEWFADQIHLVVAQAILNAQHLEKGEEMKWQFSVDHKNQLESNGMVLEFQNISLHEKAIFCMLTLTAQE